MSRTCPECQNQYEDEIAHCPEDGLNLVSVEQDDELIGRAIGSYRVIKQLGKGGMGAVYLAEHPVIGSRVAIKFLHPQYATDTKIVDRFYNEARAVNVIGHDNILKILDLNVTADNRHYFIMEFLNGRSLQNIVQPDVPVPLEVTGPILLQTCEALQAAHDHQIVHRDLKPDNIYLIVHKGRKNFVKVVDFGIAKLTDGDGNSTGKTQTGLVMGTPAYMSPEQAGGMSNLIDGRSDIYSLGAMMFQMATGKLPFPGKSFGEVLIGHLQEPPPEPRSINPLVPEAYQAIILKCLEKPQEKRFQSMHELHDALKVCLDSLGISSQLPVAGVGDAGVSTAGTSTQSSPGGKSNPKNPRPALPKTLTQRSPSQPNARLAQTQLRALPARPRTFLYLGVAAAVLLLFGGVGFLVFQSQRVAAEQVARLAQEQREAARRKEAAALAAQEREAAESQPVFLSVVTIPIGAKVEATWKSGSKSGETPMELEVTRNSKVHFAFSKPGFQAYAMDVIADSAQVVEAALPEEQRVVAASPVARPPRSPKKQKQAASLTNDSTIPVDF